MDRLLPKPSLLFKSLEEQPMSTHLDVATPSLDQRITAAHDTVLASFAAHGRALDSLMDDVRSFRTELEASHKEHQEALDAFTLRLISETDELNTFIESAFAELRHELGGKADKKPGLLSRLLRRRK